MVKKSKVDRRPRVVVLLSDLHVGAVAGLLPPDFVTFEGNPVEQNPYQKWLWNCWLDCWEWSRKVIGDDQWLCVLNGDLIDGNHHQTKEIISPDTGDHMSAAIEALIDVLKPADGVYLTEGTHVHSGNQEHGIASVLSWHGVKIMKPHGKKAAWPEMDLNVAGTLVTVDHHVGTTGRSYTEAGAYSTTMADVTNRRSRAGWRVPKLIVRSHRHQYGLFSDGYRTMVVLPPWQGATRFTRRVVPGIVPQCGMVIADWRTCEDNSPPVIHTRIHTVKQPFAHAA